ncbi:hypothetical protein [Actinomadura chokoriensis]|uniref:Uncharacterized protein n=1 Tax=Actinomadura chokoriensis TaxID=454156 RepID=A0ABV4R748_9ACTN
MSRSLTEVSTVKRGVVAVLASVLVLGGCGGSDGGAGDEGAGTPPPSPGVSAPAPAPSGRAPSPTPVPPQVSKATDRFSDCMHKQGVELPSPNPTVSPARKDLEKIKAALRICVKSMSASPPPAN